MLCQCFVNAKGELPLGVLGAGACPRRAALRRVQTVGVPGVDLVLVPLVLVLLPLASRTPTLALLPRRNRPRTFTLGNCLSVEQVALGTGAHVYSFGLRGTRFL